MPWITTHGITNIMYGHEYASYRPKSDQQTKLLIVLITILKNYYKKLNVYSELGDALGLYQKKTIHIAVSHDGSWLKRGFSSKYWIGRVIEVITGLVTDYDVLSKYCRVCEKKKAETNEVSEEFDELYQPSCQANCDGSSPGMGNEENERIWPGMGTRGRVISDGDSKTKYRVSSLNIYGDDIVIGNRNVLTTSLSV